MSAKQNIAAPSQPDAKAPGAEWPFKDKIAAALGLRKQAIRLPRAVCRWVRMDLAGIPAKMHGSSIRLQLLQLSGIAKPGFAWKTKDGAADVWYWDEQSLRDQGLLPASTGDKNDPFPETLFHMPQGHGLHLVACATGYECLALDAAGIRKTRWFDSIPSGDAWQAFVRDAGLDPATSPLPDVEKPPEQDPVAAGWKTHSDAAGAPSSFYWAGIVAVTLLGAMLSYAVTFNLKLVWRNHELSSEYRQLAQENAGLIALGNKIAEHQGFLSAFKSVRPDASQLLLLKNLVDTGVFGEETRISLLEWEYRSGRLRLLFAVPQDDFSLSLFLSALERQDGVADVRLLPDTPPATIGVQISLVGAGGVVAGGAK